VWAGCGKLVENQFDWKPKETFSLFLIRKPKRKYGCGRLGARVVELFWAESTVGVDNFFAQFSAFFHHSVL
jgi:hypothetical protein